MVKEVVKKTSKKSTVKSKEKPTKKIKKKQITETKGIVAFTLAISGFFLLVFSNPAISLVFFIVGLILALQQQKIKKTIVGKRGILLNSIGVGISIIWWIVLVKVVMPYLMANVGNLGL
ncbi:MAG: hypothetical protein PF542_06005 [Nanoarchaeota archaeon]|jgi:K+-sensing histidine kinase KdpD|nr:hypothetical protein [Nanoarchaeota archaeon]